MYVLAAKHGHIFRILLELETDTMSGEMKVSWATMDGIIVFRLDLIQWMGGWWGEIDTLIVLLILGLLNRHFGLDSLTRCC